LIIGSLCAICAHELEFNWKVSTKYSFQVIIIYINYLSL